MAYAAGEVIYAKDISISIGTGANRKVLGCATSGTLSLSADTIDTSSKCSGQWKSSAASQVGWEITTDIQFMDDGAAGATMVNYNTLFTAMVNRTPVDVSYGTPNNSPIGVTGKAWVTKLDLQGGTNDIATASVTLTGTGALTPVAVVTPPAQ